jgi:hypothetical protein
MKVRTASASLLFAAFFILGSTVVSAQWRTLGSETVAGRGDTDTIRVTGLRGDFKRIKLRVTGGPVRFRRVVITYGNGTTQQVLMRSLIRAGGETRAINLSGNERVIRKVDFWYDRASLGGKRPRVTLYGRD